MNASINLNQAARITMLLALALAASMSATADEHTAGGHEPAREQRIEQHVDARYNHNRTYPVRGYVAPHLPQSAIVSHFGGRTYYFNGGVWYRPFPGGFTVVAPPFGLVLPVLPPFYTTIWFSGVPYYYASDTYYMWSADQNGYIVTPPPQVPDAAATQSVEADQLFIDPRNGQSAEQQSTDRYECHSWARQGSGFDPTQPQSGADASQVAQRRSQYQRAEQACLESRGYTVRSGAPHVSSPQIPACCRRA